ncbi:MAG: YbcC family protein [Anaerolineae bacterium]
MIVQSDIPNTGDTLAEAEVIHAAAERACRRMAPLWPLKSFVAVNPYLGLTDHTFDQAASLIAQRAGARMVAPLAFYAEALQRGYITQDDLQSAIDSVPSVPQGVHALRAFAEDGAHEPALHATVPTVADAAERVTGQDWTDVVTELISLWAASYFDQGQAYWPSPWRDLAPYAAWHAEAQINRAPEVHGIRGFRQVISSLPGSARATIEVAAKRLALPNDHIEAYLHRLLLTINGWASYGRYQLWEAELYGRDNSALTELLAIRLAWEVALLEAFADQDIEDAWNHLKVETHDLDETVQTRIANELLLQCAFENAYQRHLFNQLGTPGQPDRAPERMAVQAAFCIDVRSEVFRRALETVSDDIATIGFAGFFGFPIEYVRLGDSHGGAQCPVLLTPQFVIGESIAGAPEQKIEEVRQKRSMRQRVTKAWRMFKFGAASCFGFVGPVGLAYIRHLLRDTFGLGRPVALPAAFGLDKNAYTNLGPDLNATRARLTGFPVEERVDVAEGVLKAMSLAEGFARLVVLAGHGSTTVNNPYASGLDCGACGGHSGEANARVAAAVLNDPDVRRGLAQRDIHIPEGTHFIAALHDTTTDTVTLFDRDSIPASHRDDIARLEGALVEAGRLARLERAPLLHTEQAANIDKAIMRRSTDWSQVRPEWGLAGCAAFIAAPRERTTHVDLKGRSFLHSYDWQQDEGFGVLELIMTAPMIVASWIILQYYVSTVDNDVFGSGNKVLHNVVGAMGVLEGNGGDLRVGLPWQSVHDGEKYIHEPLRLTVIIEAPIEAMTDIIARHDQVRELVDNGWLHLFAMGNDGRVSYRYTGGLTWACVDPVHTTHNNHRE